MAGPSSGSNYIGSGSLEDVLEAEDKSVAAALAKETEQNFSLDNPKLSSNLDSGELFKTDTGQYNKLEENEVKNQPPTSDAEGSSPAAPPEPPYYIYGKNTSSNTYPVSFAQNLFGANTDVVAPLKEIDFKSSFDGSLQNAIAYIVPWKRTGFNSRTPANPTATDTPASQNIPTLADDLGIDLKFDPPPEMGDLYGGTGIGTTGDPLSSPNFYSSDNNLPNFLGDTTPPKWDTDQSKWYDGSIDYQVDTQTYTPATDVKGNKPTTQNQQAAEDKQKALGSEIPMGLQQGLLAGTSLLAGSLLQDNPQLSSIAGTGINQIAGKVFNVPTGPIYIGNEDGILNQVVSGASSLAAMFGINIPRGLTTTVFPDRQPKTSKEGSLNATISPRTDGAWQFLFNPSELTLTAGPEYSKSETWGVMDNKEAGVPLQFNRMKNPQLKFNGIKLNGYVFGRQVEDLEQGLFKLMMTAGGADNGASAGPQVLEFVWGKKTFGPCVIKDISITEKMWDNGLLVNADLNFVLEKIPEWTVNDGQVSVYAPYTKPTQTAPEEQKKETPDEEEKQEPAPDDAESYPYNQCKLLATAIKDTGQLIANGKYLSKEAANNFSNPLNFVKERIGAIDAYDRMLSQYSNWLTRVNKADSSTLYPTKCGRDYFNQKRTELTLLPGAVNSDEKAEFSSKTILEMNACIDIIRKTTINSYNQGKCTNYKNPGSSDPFDIFPPKNTDPNQDFGDQFWTTL